MAFLGKCESGDTCDVVRIDDGDTAWVCCVDGTVVLADVVGPANVFDMKAFGRR